jgi:hypothetical protein
MTPSEAMKIMDNPKEYTVQERKDARKVLEKYGKVTAKDKTPMGISVTIATPLPRPERKGKKKTEMAYGGMAGGKKHMYAAGGMVKDNPGLKALKASGPKGMEAYKKITGK